MRTITGTLSLFAGLTLTVSTLSTVQAGAAPPTVLTDEWTEVTCTAVSDGLEITVGAGRSDQGGSQLITYSAAQLSDATTGETKGGGESDSWWSDTTFHASIPIYALVPGDGSGGHRYFSSTGTDDTSYQESLVMGQVVFEGSFVPSADSVTYPVKGQDGNIHFDQTNTLTPLVVEVETLTYTPTDPAESVTFADVTCMGEAGSGTLKYTNPHTVVRHEDDTTAQCETNADNYEVWREEDGWFVSVSYVDILPDDDEDPENNVQLWSTAAGLISFESDGTWEGELEVITNTEPGTEVRHLADASATFLREGQPFHLTQEDRQGLRDHAHFTPHRLALVVDHSDPYADGTSGVTELNCLVNTVEVTTRTVNQPEE